MAISTRDFTENICITFNNRVYTITECFHLSPVKGPAMVRTKLRDIKTGRVTNNAFNAAANVEYVEADKKAAIYKQSNMYGYVFEAIDGGERLQLSNDLIENATQWMHEGDEIALVYIEGVLEGLEPLINAGK